jgi:hypothetical protein
MAPTSTHLRREVLLDLRARGRVAFAGHVLQEGADEALRRHGEAQERNVKIEEVARLLALVRLRQLICGARAKV